MRQVLSLLALAGVGLFSAWAVGRIDAQEPAQPVKSSRGGLMARAGRHQFEVFFYPTGVRVFAQDRTGAVVDASRLTGTATFYHPNSPKPWFSRPLRGEPASLDLAVGLSDAPAVGAKVVFEVMGLSDPSESIASFTLPLEFVSTPGAQITPPRGEVPAVPPYTYGPGYQGYGYYENTSPGTYSAASGSRSYMSSIPGMYAPGGMNVGPGHRD